jgi:hypothetical protein
VIVADGRDTAAALHRLELACIEPWIIAARKRRRLAAFGIETLDGIPCGDLDLALDTSECPPACACLTAGERRYFARYLFDLAPRAGFVPPVWRGVPSVVDLDRYPDFASYADRLRRHSKGGVLRQIRKARAQGFFCRRIYSDFYRRQRFAIDTSKRFRSGLVLASLLRRSPESDFPQTVPLAEIAARLGRAPAEIIDGIPLPEPPPPACPLHWRIDWGVFIREDAAGDPRCNTPRERLIGYVFLKRTGNVVRTAGLMGHGAYLSRNVMKLLLHDVIDWLLTRADPSVQGLRYLNYGAIEHGNEGLSAWKRSFEFAPLRFRKRLATSD